MASCARLLTAHSFSGPSSALELAGKWESYMLAGAIVAVLLIFGLFLSMLSSSPRADAEYNPDTEA
jgi:hypothetical protein